ncbi:primosomal protein N' [Clostridia bacterium]|nr:primosomal protein N' [Clostridia bacterium]
MIAKIVVANVNKVFDYVAPADVEIGARVFVPFGARNKLTEGIVIALSEQPENSSLKSISKIIDTTPLITPELVELAMWMKEHYFCTFGQAFQCVMPSGEKKEKIVKFVRLVQRDVDIEKLPMNQAKVYNALAQMGRMKLADLVGGNAGLRSAVSGLVKKGIVEVFEGEENRNGFQVDDYVKTYPLEPTPEQEHVLATLSVSSSRPFMLRGVTGSGKTEVFLQAIGRVIEAGRQAIVLVPEISLTPQIVERFVGRFGNKVSVLHSALSAGERFDEWRRILRGEVCVAVGARSAIFAPFSNLGIIIIDEEQEGAYKSEHSPKYTAHEVAKWRAKRNNAQLILASATPSITSFHAAQTGEYELLTMEKRHNSAPMPMVDVVDMRLEMASGNKSMFSEELAREIKANLDNGEQTILFLNRRGYNTFVSCRSCGEAIKCKHCNVTLTYHKNIGRMVCHYCDYSEPTAKVCPECGSPYIRFFGDGTQKIEAEISEHFPSASFIRMDMDTTGGKNAHQAILNEFRDKKIDILIGTQMVTKGLDFANVTLVGVMAADLALNVSDYRAFERTFSQLTQVCGRAGRGDKVGRAIIQTYQPDHFVIRLARNHDYCKFYESEIAMRKRFSNPPLRDIIMLMATGDDQKHLQNSLKEAIKMLGGTLQIVPPAPAPITRIKGLYRWRTLIKCENIDSAMRLRLGEILEHFRKDKKLVMSIDINPNSML